MPQPKSDRVQRERKEDPHQKGQPPHGGARRDDRDPDREERSRSPQRAKARAPEETRKPEKKEAPDQKPRTPAPEESRTRPILPAPRKATPGLEKTPEKKGEDQKPKVITPQKQRTAPEAKPADRDQKKPSAAEHQKPTNPQTEKPRTAPELKQSGRDQRNTPNLPDPRSVPSAHNRVAMPEHGQKAVQNQQKSSQDQERTKRVPPQPVDNDRQTLTGPQRAALGVAAVAFLAGTKPGRNAAEWFGKTVRREQDIRFAEAVTPDTVIHNHHTIVNDYSHYGHCHGSVRYLAPPPPPTFVAIVPPPPPIYYAAPVMAVPVFVPPPPPVYLIETHLRSRCSYEQQTLFVAAAEAHYLTGDPRAGYVAAEILESTGYSFSGGFESVGSELTAVGFNVGHVRNSLGSHTNFSFGYSEGGFDDSTRAFLNFHLVD